MGALPPLPIKFLAFLIIMVGFTTLVTVETLGGDEGSFTQGSDACYQSNDFCNNTAEAGQTKTGTLEIIRSLFTLEVFDMPWWITVPLLTIVTLGLGWILLTVAIGIIP